MGKKAQAYDASRKEGRRMKDYFIEVLNPENVCGPKVMAIIPYRLIEAYYKYSIVRWENFRAAKHVLQNPLRIFSGVRQFNEGGWCFTGRPETWYIKENVTASFPGNLIYAVYLNPRLCIYECRAEIVSDNDKSSPNDWQNRYKGLIWKSTS